MCCLLLLGVKGALLVDPMCGSGTLLVEAALMATNTAPGLLRDTGQYVVCELGGEGFQRCRV